MVAEFHSEGKDHAICGQIAALFLQEIQDSKVAANSIGSGQIHCNPFAQQKPGRKLE
jgi:hypothetical protein